MENWKNRRWVEAGSDEVNVICNFCGNVIECGGFGRKLCPLCLHTFSVTLDEYGVMCIWDEEGRC